METVPVPLQAPSKPANGPTGMACGHRQQQDPHASASGLEGVPEPLCRMECRVSFPKRALCNRVMPRLIEA